jgi:hypothetical protein
MKESSPNRLPLSHFAHDYGTTSCVSHWHHSRDLAVGESAS